MFVPNSKITIGDTSFSGVHELEIHKSLLGYVQTGELKLPGRMRLRRRSNPNDIKVLETYKHFKEGDSVRIQLGYNGTYNEEFVGFVQRVDQSIPVRIHLEGYSYQLKRNNVNKFWASATIKEIMQEAVKGTDIKLDVADNMPVVNFRAENATGAQVLDKLIKDVCLGELTAYFVKPDTLWLGLRYTNYLGDVKYQFGLNVINDDQLVKRIGDNTKVKIEAFHKDSTGKRTRAESSKNKKITEVGQVQKINAKSISDAKALKQLTDAKLENKQYEGLEGEITTFLYPFAAPGYKAVLKDARYDRSGSYIIDYTKVKYGVRGARRTIGIGRSV